MAQPRPWRRGALDGPVGHRPNGALGRFSVEAGAGVGLSSMSADWLGWVEVSWTSRTLWTDAVDALSRRLPPPR